MADKFDIGMVLIEGVMKHRRSFIQDSIHDPADKLTIHLSYEARDCIIQTLVGQNAQYGKVDLKQGQGLTQLVGLPVVVRPDTTIMYIYEEA